MEDIILKVVGAIAGSAGAQLAGKQFSTAVWESVKPYLIVEDDEELTTAVEEVRAGGEVTPAAEAKVAERLRTVLTEDPKRLEELQGLMTTHNTQNNTVYNQTAEKIISQSTISTESGDINL